MNEREEEWTVANLATAQKEDKCTEQKSLSAAQLQKRLQKKTSSRA